MEQKRYRPRLEILQGTLDMLILQTLQWGPQHGYAIGQTIRTESAESLKIETGSLYPALHRLEKQGWVKSDWKLTEANQRAKFYRLTPKGKKQLLQERDRWSQLVSAIGTILNPKRIKGLSMNPLRWLFRRGRIEGDLDTEIRSHFEMAIAERIAAGEDPESARLAAINEFGNVLQAKEEARDVWRGGLVATLADVWQDVRFGVRMLVKNPAFSLVVITVLSIGIAGNAAIFSLFKGLALKPLPGVRDSPTMSVLLGRTIDGRVDRRVGARLSRHREAATRHSRALTRLDRWCSRASDAASTPNASSPSSSSAITFETLGVGAQLGRMLLPSDDVAPGQHPVAVISDSLWRRSFAADPARRRQDALPQRPAAHHRRRRRPGFQRHRRQHGHGCVRAAHDAAAAVAAEPPRHARDLQPDDDRSSQAGRDVRQAATAEAGVFASQLEARTSHSEFRCDDLKWCRSGNRRSARRHTGCRRSPCSAAWAC